MKKKYSWDELYTRADGAAYGDDELVAKDEARWQVTQNMLDNGFSNPDDEECPEDWIENYCDMYGVEFDERGNIVGYNIPGKIAEFMIHKISKIELFKFTEQMAPDASEAEKNHLRCLWTAYCLIFRISVDTSKYDSTIAGLWYDTGLEGVGLWTDFDDFDGYMCEYLV